MSTLEKTIGLLKSLDEKQIEMVYQFILFLVSEKQNVEERKDNISEEIKEFLEYFCVEKSDNSFVKESNSIF